MRSVFRAAVVALILAPSVATVAPQVPAARESLSVHGLLSAPFPTDLAASPTGGRFAWVASATGVHNIWIADPLSYAGRQLTAYVADDGQWISELAWTADASALVYTRGEGPNRDGVSPNPAHAPDGAEQAVWTVPAGGGEPRRVAAGHAPKPAPNGLRLAWLSSGEIWTADLATGDKPSRLVSTRGRATTLAWSPDGTWLAFVTDRSTHSFVGVVNVSSREVRYLEPSFDRDSHPAWSPDGTRLAFIREFAADRPQMFAPLRSVSEPWAIRIVDVSTGRGRQVWRAEPGYGSVFRGVVSDEQLMWGEGDRIVFPWEKDGWLRLYSVAASGGAATLLTPGAFEVEYVALTPEGARVLYSSNQGDIDRRHLWAVGIDGRGGASQVTRGPGIEWQPVMASTGTATAFFRSGARTPPHVAVLTGEMPPRPVPGTLPSDFPEARLVEPLGVTVTATDGMLIPAQLFLPADLKPGERRPAVIFTHGGSRRQMLLGWHYMYYYRNAYAMNQWLASRGYVVLSLNYRSGIGYGLEFREATNYGATGASEFQDLVGAGLYLRSRPDVDPARIGLWGGSYGGYLTAMGLARASDLFAAGVDVHGVHDWNQGIRTFRPDYDTLDHPEFARKAFESSPLAAVDTWRSPVLLIHGDDDRNVSFVESINLIGALRKRGVEVEHLVFPDEVHDFLLHRHWVAAFEAAGDFFDRRLGTAAAARD